MKYKIVILMLFILLVPLKTDLSAGSIDTTNLIAYPNPFKPQQHGQVTIGYYPDPSDSYAMDIKVYNINGDLVSTISVALASGLYSTTWNGRNSRGALVNPGLYMIRVKIDDINGNSAVKVLRLLVNH